MNCPAARAASRTYRTSVCARGEGAALPLAAGRAANESVRPSTGSGRTALLAFRGSARAAQPASRAADPWRTRGTARARHSRAARHWMSARRLAGDRVRQVGDAGDDGVGRVGIEIRARRDAGEHGDEVRLRLPGGIGVGHTVPHVAGG